MAPTHCRDEFPHITAAWRLAYVKELNSEFTGTLDNFREFWANSVKSPNKPNKTQEV